MRTLRQLHLYLGCVFAPLLIYFALSGTWQVFRLNDLPKDGSGSPVRTLLHELSKPHKSATLPGEDPKISRSLPFQGMTAAMGVGIIVTSLLGILIALRSSRQPRIAAACLALGVLLPICLLLLSL